MNKDKLSEIWNSQDTTLSLEKPESIIKKANKQRNTQFISIAVMSTTVLILIAYATYYLKFNWTSFTLGLVLMISSLSFRILLEFITLYQKENKLISLDNRLFKKYLKKHYKLRMRINYIVTPICFFLYVYGFVLLLPYFKQIFSKGFYLYLLISGFASIFVIGIIVIRTVKNESNFLKHLNQK